LIVADTNVVSEFMRERPDPSVAAWAAALKAGDLTISVITVEEIERGLAGLSAGRRRRELERRWRQLVDAYAHRSLLRHACRPGNRPRPGQPRVRRVPDELG